MSLIYFLSVPQLLARDVYKGPSETKTVVQCFLVKLFQSQILFLVIKKLLQFLRYFVVLLTFFCFIHIRVGCVVMSFDLRIESIPLRSELLDILLNFLE